MHLFIDGSCLNPTCPFTRIASWGVVCADIGQDRYVEVSQGPLSGIHQTVFRAECVAAISAIKFGLVSSKPFWIWVDNQHVFHILKSLRLGYPIVVHSGHKDHDLICQLIDLTRRALDSALFEDVVKVCSHQNHALAESVIERWAFRGNDAADKSAERGRSAFPSQTFRIWEALVKELETTRSCRDALHSHFIQVGQQAVFDKRAHQSVETERWETSMTEDKTISDDIVVSFQQFDILQPKGPLDFLGPTGYIVLQWLDGILNAPEGTLVWVTGLHLLTDFQMQTQQLGVWRNSVTKFWEPYDDSMVGTRYNFLQAARQFSGFLRTIGRLFGVPTKCYPQRPSGTSFRRWTKCMLMKVPRDRLLQIDRKWFHARVSPIDIIQTSFGKVSHFMST